MITGVDVSPRWQKDIDFKALKRQGYNFAGIKATQGTWLSYQQDNSKLGIVHENLADMVARCNAADMAHFLYHFLDPVQDGYQDGNEQLDYFLEETKGLHGQLPNALDTEWQGDLTHLHLQALVMDFLSNTNLRWLLYSNLDFLDFRLYGIRKEIVEHADIWLAWPSGFRPCKMPVHYPEESVKIWQWDWSDKLDKNRVLDEVWYYSHVPPQIYGTVKMIVSPGITVDIEYE
jgi:GH25 family lysozyme M1 (1,4-beta-N-acetylmuramidase)